MNLKKKIIIIIITMLFVFSNLTLLTLSAADLKLKPKIFFDIESGERYSEVEDDYTDYDYDIEHSYKYLISKFGYKQKFNKLTDFSIILKNNRKEYIFSGDAHLDNVANSMLGYIKRDINNSVELKLDWSALKRKFDETISADKESYWIKTGLSLKYSPDKTSFFTNKNNVYNLKIFYKKQEYDIAHNKDLFSKGIAAEWQLKLTEALRLETRGNYYTNNYRQESAQRQNSDKYSIGLRFEYDFNN